MVLPGHLAGGYIATTALLALGHPALSPGELDALLAVGTLAGEGPDVDLFLFYFNQRSATAKKRADHREYPTHIPLVWLIGCLALSGIGSAFGSAFVVWLGLVILVGSWSHLILDSIESGIPWLWPLSKKRLCLKRAVEPQIDRPVGTLGYYSEFVFKHYFKNVTFYAEILIVVLALYLAFLR